MSLMGEKAAEKAAEGGGAEDPIPPSPTAKEDESDLAHNSRRASSSSSVQLSNHDHDPASPENVDNTDLKELQPTKSQSENMGAARIAIIMLSLCIALFLAALDVTIITTALPTIAGHFTASAADYTWVGSAYLLANASSTPVWGKLSDIWGRKPVILLANIVFMVGSLIAALSVSIGMLIGGRVVQGIGGGGLVILVNICISDLFSMRDRAKYFGIVGMTWAIASALGPVLGGIFTEKVSWRWCFYVNLPLDGFAFVMLVFFLKIETPKTPFLAGIRAIDWLGVVAIVGGVVMFLIGMESGGLSHPWASAFTLCLIIFGLVGIALFFVNEWKLAKYPIMPLRLFNDYSNVAALGVCFCHGFVFIGATYYLPLYFQTVLAATPILSGVYLFPLAISLSLSSALTGLVIKVTGRYREPIWFGLFFMTVGFGLFIDLDDYANWAKIIVFQIIAGIGVGPNFQSPLIALQSHVKGHDIAVATATFGFIRNISTSISVVLGGVIFQNELSKKEPMLQRALGPELANRLARSSFGSTTALLRKLPHDQKVVLDQAYTSSLRSIWIFYLAVSVLGIIISLFITKKELSKQHEKTRTGIAEQERVRQEVKAEKVARMNESVKSPPGTRDGDTSKKSVEEV